MSIFRKLFGTKPTPSPDGTTPRPPSGSDPLIENPRLAAVMLAFARGGGPQGQLELVRELQMATFLAPIVTEGTDIPPGRQLRFGSPELGDKLNLANCIDPSGGHQVPLFTDWPVLRSWAAHQTGSDNYFSAIVMSPTEAWQWVLSSPIWAGAIIFSSEVSVPLPRPVIQQLCDQLNHPSSPMN